MIKHFPTCAIWQTGDFVDCDCAGARPWQVKKIDGGDDYPWVVFRKTDDGEEPFLFCRSQTSALQLASGMDWLSREGLRT